MSHQHKDKSCHLDQTQSSVEAKIPAARNSAQVSAMINEGDPNVQPVVPVPVAQDLQEAQVVKQAIKDDQGLAAVAKDIVVTVKDGAVTLDGKVSSEQQMNLATNTAKAVAVDEKVKNHLEVTHKKEGCHENKESS